MSSALRRRTHGFTRLDLTALVGSMGLLSLLVLAGGSTTRPTSEATVCNDNVRRLTQAWQAHASDNGRLIGNPNAGAGRTGDPTKDNDWAVWKWLTWGPEPDNTNKAHLQTTAFVPYVGKDTRIFRCPSDRFVSKTQRALGWQYRVRSYSMNSYVGSSSSFDPGYRSFLRMEDFTQPSQTFVFVEEHPDSINDPWFAARPDGRGTYDLPSSLHARGLNLGFADDHVERHRWRSSNMVQRVRLGYASSIDRPDDDTRWLGSRASQLR